MSRPSGYLLCATPRTGSTLLCSLLASTEALGRPESYFREPVDDWARRLDVPITDGRVHSYGDFVQAVRTAATSTNGVFGARVMWASLEGIADGLRDRPGRADREVLEAALGPLEYVFLRRENVVDQAVSWARAEQTGHWQHGDPRVRSPQLDVAQLVHLVDTIREHNAAWQAWFDHHQVRPHLVTHEELVADRRATVEAIAARLQVVLPANWQPVSPHRKQADGLNHAWAEALRSALDGNG